ncbi:hypothetical protein [Rodentibacter genomosp. 2]|uniref:Uncharacterized protein n=1 Tax=Rodentibacter genomosp. 2 TaxID=1908266 RepID=A0A1V3JPV7_9PAST|nr:hypothetical protein [Rodentibacter genomosp. 2]OOF58292.1 hypothetical protein BKK55_02670 [Rodentibacter genomosp. 2]
MLTNNKWIPAVPRPNLDSEEAFAEFLKTWVAENYKDEIQAYINCFDDDEDEEEFDFNIEEFGIYQSILEEWNGDDEDTAEDLIKRQSWSYREAKAFEEKRLSWDSDKHEEKLAIEWVKQNGYELPFPVGSRVKWRKYEGIIQEDKNNYYLPKGLVCVLTDEMAEENQRNAEKGISSRQGGYIAKWEDLELVD